MIKIYPLLLSLVLISCFTPQHLGYLGNSYPPTKTVDVYVDASAIKRPYTIIGKSYVDRNHLLATDDMIQSAAVEKAKQKGADAILFQDYTVISGNTIQTVSKSDSIGSSSVRLRTTTVAPVETDRLDILFLKYD